MLGSVGSANSWQWAAWGKHPAARDYFGVGPPDPLVKAFSDWVERGFKTLNPKGDELSGPSSWRFWARGAKRKTIVCGVVRDSSDSLGRPYPLLVMGVGIIEGWEDQWDLLPFACEKTWCQMEHLSAMGSASFGELEAQVKALVPPYPVWLEFMSQKGGLHEASSVGENAGSSPSIKELANRLATVSQGKDFFASLDGGLANDPQTLAALWHGLMKARMSDIPSAVFMGGTPDQASLAVFKRALAPTDFVRLWSGEG
ncbi:MAG: type VI secretion system-associated protein TagF [Thermodesulfobacteriota bacterium]|nr:type VI secretion system-associated protein TagF [Thermodesulfobacteriota bacterium]